LIRQSMVSRISIWTTGSSPVVTIARNRLISIGG
jgi:hypothetical protein